MTLMAWCLCLALVACFPIRAVLRCSYHRLSHRAGVSHCFHVNGNPTNPEVPGVLGVLNAYQQSFAAGVRLSGPTYFGPVINNAAAVCSPIYFFYFDCFRLRSRLYRARTVLTLISFCSSSPTVPSTTSTKLSMRHVHSTILPPPLTSARLSRRASCPCPLSLWASGRPTLAP